LRRKRGLDCAFQNCCITKRNLRLNAAIVRIHDIAKTP
jgi:hypothetical protein